MKLVSVIIPTHGGGEYLVKTIESALEQDYDELEVIVVDDNGKDTPNQLLTQEKIKKHIGNPKFKYIINDKNMNGSVSRNNGVKYSNGDYLNFIDDDDFFLPGKIRYQVEQLNNLSSDWGASYSSRVTTFEGRGIRKSFAKQSGNVLYEYMLHKVTMGTGSLLIRKSVFIDIGGYDESFIRHQDWEFVARIADNYKIASAGPVFFERNYTFRHGPKSIKKAEEFMDYYTLVMNEKIKSLTPKQMKNVITNNYAGISLKYLRQGEYKDFIRIFKKNCLSLVGIISIVRIGVKYSFNQIIGKKYT